MDDLSGKRRFFRAGDLHASAAALVFSPPPAYNPLRRAAARHMHTSTGEARVPFSDTDTLQDLLDRAAQKYALEFEDVGVAGKTLRVLQIADMRERLDAMIRSGALDDALNSLPLWAKIWPASLALAHALNARKDKGTLLEIGAGCGVVGLAAAACGFRRVVVSDINEDALLFARINALQNNLADRVEVVRLDIRDPEPPSGFDLVAGAEILYLEDLYRPLVKFLGRVGAPETLLASDHRRAPKRFFKLAEKEFTLGHKQLGLRGKGEDETEKHLISLHRLTSKI